MSRPGLRVCCVQHVPFEGPGALARALAARGAAVTVTRPYEGHPFPPPRDIDLLIVLGGPMSVHDERAHPWLVTEKRCVSDAVAAGTRVLGICLGAQLIAAAAGAAVRPNGEREIGWHPVECLDDGALGGALAAPLTPFHWHGETFDLPAGAVQLARSAACEQQAFALGERVVGLQFHVEMTPGGVAALVESCRAELVPGRYVQSPLEMLSDAARFTAIHGRMHRLLDALTGAAPEAVPAA
jgi:GMP synthase-like glutamine amidotransferase